MEEGAVLGLLPAQLLDLTVRELAAYGKGFARRDTLVWRRTLWGAWHGAAFARAKRLPNLQRLLRGLGRARPVQKTTAQLVAVAERLNALFGGKDLRKRKG